MQVTIDTTATAMMNNSFELILYSQILWNTVMNVFIDNQGGYLCGFSRVNVVQQGESSLCIGVLGVVKYNSHAGNNISPTPGILVCHLTLGTASKPFPCSAISFSSCIEGVTVTRREFRWRAASFARPP